MLVYYSCASGKQNISAEVPANESPENVLNIFRLLDRRKGFLGIIIDETFRLQLLPKKVGVRIELLKSSLCSLESCETEDGIAEQLIKAAATGQDVFQIGHNLIEKWEFLDLKTGSRKAPC